MSNNTTLKQYEWGTSSTTTSNSPYYSLHSDTYYRPSPHHTSHNSPTDEIPVLSLKDAYALPEVVSPSEYAPPNSPPTSKPTLASSSNSPLSSPPTSSSVIVFAPQPVPLNHITEYLAQFGTVVSGPVALPNSPLQYSVGLDSDSAVRAALAKGLFYINSIPVGITRNANHHPHILKNKNTSSLNLATVHNDTSSFPTMTNYSSRQNSPSRQEEIEKVGSSMHLFRPVHQDPLASDTKLQDSQYQKSWVSNIARWFLDII